MMGQEYDIHLLILAAQEAGHPEEEAAGAVFFKSTHRARGVHHGNNHGIRVRDRDVIPGLVTQIIGADAVYSRVAAAGIAPQILK